MAKYSMETDLSKGNQKMWLTSGKLLIIL